RHADAAPELTRSLALEPGEPRLLHVRARAYARAGRTREAALDLAAAISIDPGFLDHHLLLALCLGRLGRGGAAASALERALELLRAGSMNPCSGRRMPDER